MMSVSLRLSSHWFLRLVKSEQIKQNLSKWRSTCRGPLGAQTPSGRPPNIYGRTKSYYSLAASGAINARLLSNTPTHNLERPARRETQHTQKRTLNKHGNRPKEPCVFQRMNERLQHSHMHIFMLLRGRSAFCCYGVLKRGMLPFQDVWVYVRSLEQIPQLWRLRTRKHRHLLTSSDSRNSWTGSRGTHTLTHTHSHTHDYLAPNQKGVSFREDPSNVCDWRSTLLFWR